MDHGPRFLQLVNAAKAKIRELTVDEVHAKQARGDRFRLIDTREDREWDAGRIAGAIHLGKGILERDIEKLAPDLDEELVLYCGGGFRSALSAEALAAMGYRNVASMDGGWREWSQRGLPTEGNSK